MSLIKMLNIYLVFVNLSLSMLINVMLIKKHVCVMCMCVCKVMSTMRMLRSVLPLLKPMAEKSL